MSDPWTAALFGAEGIVVPDGDVYPHEFIFTGTKCAGGAFLGCVAKATNENIKPENKVEGANEDGNYILNTGSLAKSYSTKLKDGIPNTANKFCRMMSCCCPQIDVFWRKDIWGGTSAPFRHKIINCSGVTKDLP